MGNIETATKLSRWKSICSIEGNCLEAATGGVLYKKAVLKNFAIFTVKQLCWNLFSITFLKSSATLLKRLQRRCFSVHNGNFYLFSNQRTAASDYSLFALVIYLFLLSFYNYDEKI